MWLRPNAQSSKDQIPELCSSQRLRVGLLPGKLAAGGTLSIVEPLNGCRETNYGGDVFAWDDFAEPPAMLSLISGNLILSFTDRPEVREVFA